MTLDHATAQSLTVTIAAGLILNMLPSIPRLIQKALRTKRPHMRHGWARNIKGYHDLETNPRTQLRVHVYGQRFWIANIPFVVYLVIFQPKLWLVWGLLLTTLYSLYANWSTDNGAAAANHTVINTTPDNAAIMRHLTHHGDERG